MPIKEDEQEEFKCMQYRESKKCTIFLSFTSNMISCGVRETILFLVKNKLVIIIIIKLLLIYFLNVEIRLIYSIFENVL